MEGFILAILIGLSLIFVVFTIISLLFPKRFFGHPTGMPPKSQNDDEPIVSTNNTKVESSEYVIPKVVDYDEDVVTVKRVDFITEKLFETGDTIRGIANTIVFMNLILVVALIVQNEYILKGACICTIICSLIIIVKIYSAGTILKETKKYFKFDSTKISSRSKDPYFNR